jgi:hypothetical protein
MRGISREGRVAANGCSSPSISTASPGGSSANSTIIVLCFGSGTSRWRECDVSPRAGSSGSHGGNAYGPIEFTSTDLKLGRARNPVLVAIIAELERLGVPRGDPFEVRRAGTREQRLSGTTFVPTRQTPWKKLRRRLETSLEALYAGSQLSWEVRLASWLVLATPGVVRRPLARRSGDPARRGPVDRLLPLDEVTGPSMNVLFTGRTWRGAASGRPRRRRARGTPTRARARRRGSPAPGPPRPRSR